MRYISKSIGEKIQEHREMSKLSQEQLSEKSNISKNYLSALERGLKTPSLMTFINICNTLDISADSLLDEVINKGYKTKVSILSEKIENTTVEKRKLIFKLINAVVDET